MSENVCKFTAQDYKSDQLIKWCPGCGDHAVVNAIQKAFAQIGRKHEDMLVISGIGCSSRFPYYMNTYGFHTIHGRANTIASGAKVANPNLSVWVATGDGDAMAIGGNHFIHSIRRNIDINVLLFNNEIYGLTKGQYSPTTKKGSVTKTSPYGTVEDPFNPGELVIGANGKFFARTIDTNIKHTTQMAIEAEKFKGASIIEILQNCVIYNDGTHCQITDKDVKHDRQLFLEQGKPMLFGKNNEKGIVLDTKELVLKVVTIGEDGYTLDDVLVHDATKENPSIHFMLAHMSAPEFPVALGVIRAVQEDVHNYDTDFEEQMEMIISKTPIKNMTDLLNSGDTWVVD